MNFSFLTPLAPRTRVPLFRGCPPPPLGEASRSGPPSRQEGVYTPTAHEGAPVRGDGHGSSPEEGRSPGSGKGPRAGVWGWRFDRGLSRRGIAAPPRTGCGRHGDRGAPPPPPPPGRAGVLGAARGRPLPVMRATEAGYAPTPGTKEPTPYQPALTPGTAAAQTKAHFPHAATHLPRVTRAWELTYGGAATRHITLAPYWPRPALVAVETATVPAPMTPPPLGWPHCPDPRPG